METWNARPAELDIPEEYGLGAGTREYLRDAIWFNILRGNTEDLEEIITEETDKIPEDDASEIVERFIAARLAQQTEIGQVESRLSAAFEELDASGIVAREDFTCCQNCLLTEIGAEIPDDGADGFVAFHEQDTERFFEDGVLYLAYGAFIDSHMPASEWNTMSEAEQQAWTQDVSVRMVRERIIPVLEKHGMSVEWDGSTSSRLAVRNADFYVPLAVERSSSPAILLLPVVDAPRQTDDGYVFPLKDDDEFVVTFDPDQQHGRSSLTWVDVTEVSPFAEWEVAANGDVQIILTDEASDAFDAPHQIVLRWPDGDVTVAAAEVRRQLLELGEIAGPVGVGGTIFSADDGTAENIALAETPYGPLIFIRVRELDDEDRAEGLDRVGLSRGEDAMFDGITGWGLIAPGVVRLEIDQDTQDELDLPETMDIPFDPPEDADAAFEAVARMLRETGEMDSADRMIPRD